MSDALSRDNVARCAWVGSDPLMRTYHDTEWGQRVHDETRLFEKLCLEGFQAGLSWRTVLTKRASFRTAYDGFDPELIAAYSAQDVALRAADKALIRQHAKHAAVVQNAQAYLGLRNTGGSLNALVFATYDPHRPRPKHEADIAVSTPASTALAKTLKQRGFVFVGPVTMYALMQACGAVNDHVERCATSVSQQ